METKISQKIGDVDLWEERKAGQCDAAGMTYYLLLKTIDTGRLKDVPKLFADVIEQQAWKHWRWIGNEFSASTLDDYITKHPPKGLGASVDLVRRLLADNHKALDLFERARRGESAVDVDAKDRENKEASRQGQRTDLLYNNESNIQEVKAPTGTSAAAFVRRLRKDRPDIHARVLAGELTPHAGMIEAGFRKKPVRIKLTKVEWVLKSIAKLSRPERRAIWRQLDDEFG
jgi:hypothetical protein